MPQRRSFVAKVVSAGALQKGHRPYLLIWALYYAWVVIFTTWWTATPASDRVYTADIRSVIHAANLFSSAVFICFYKKEWFAKTARAGAAILLCGVTAFLLLTPAGLQIYAAPAVGVMLGFVNVSILIPYVYIMNNTEKFYAMLVAFAGVNLASLLYRPEWIGSLGEKLVSLAVLAAALSFAFKFRKSDLDTQDAALPAGSVKKIAYWSLAINCFFAVFIKGVGKIMLDSIPDAGQGAFLWHFAGGARLLRRVLARVRAHTRQPVHGVERHFFRVSACGAWLRFCAVLSCGRIRDGGVDRVFGHHRDDHALLQYGRCGPKIPKYEPPQAGAVVWPDWRGRKRRLGQFCKIRPRRGGALADGGVRACHGGLFHRVPAAPPHVFQG
jgi:hypothetical protein